MKSRGHFKLLVSGTVRCHSHPPPPGECPLTSTYKQPFMNSDRSAMVATMSLPRRMTQGKRSAGATRSSTACMPLVPSARGTQPQHPLRKPSVNFPPKADQLMTDGLPATVGRSGHSSVTVSMLPSQFMSRFPCPSIVAYRRI